MLARLFVIVRSPLTIPEGEQFTVYEYEDTGYRVRMYPPRRSDRAPALDPGDQIKIDGVLAFQADALQIDFQKESFERGRNSSYDPPEVVINRAINSFLIRLRHVVRAGQIRQVEFPHATWRLQYLNDDESELERDENLIRGRGTLGFSMSWIALNKKIWDDVQKLPIDYEPPPWEGLLLDASTDLPNIGQALVLAATSLEVLISYVLDKLASLKAVPDELWLWINKRGDRLREPTVEEQYDTLLKFFVGHSLKEEAGLWESFKNLKTARNSFVHEGTAKIGGMPVTPNVARKLITDAGEITSKVREWVPEEMRWPEYRHTVHLEIVKKFPGN